MILITNNPEWEFAGVFADKGISGTLTEKRDSFNEMLDECNKGNIDIILTKSISRFARNTVDSLTTIRKLKENGVEVYFEKEKFNQASYFFNKLQRQSGLITEFNQVLWSSLVDHVTVYSKDKITVTFRDGTEI